MLFLCSRSPVNSTFLKGFVVISLPTLMSLQPAGGYTPLSCAAAYGRAEYIPRLLEAGADVNLKDGVSFFVEFWWFVAG